ncbi:MAG: tRNA (N6-threonylcarbamoyladenosine(37)-N6)-methyltransferase TrmO [Chlamydiota bacterium]
MNDGRCTLSLRPIGVIRSPFTEAAGTPIQTVFAADARGCVEMYPEYKEGLRDLAGFERIWLIYLLDRVTEARLRVIPFRDIVERGIFATRAPCRPNRIGLSCVRVLSIRGNRIRIGDVDILNGTPLLDIKPYVPMVDSFPKSRYGWLENAPVNRTIADDRFAPRRKKTRR